LKHSVGYGPGLKSIIVKNGRERLDTSGCRSKKFYLLIIETCQTTIKMQIRSFPSLCLSLSVYYSLCCFYPYLIYERNVIIYKLIIRWLRKCERYSRSILISISLLLDMFVSLDLHIWNKIIASHPLCFLFSSSIICCIMYEVSTYFKLRIFFG
jgi:hypothetical protein